MGHFTTATLLILLGGAAVSSPVVRRSDNTISVAGHHVHWPVERPLPVKITKLPHGGHVGWVHRHKQIGGEIASPPDTFKHKLPKDMPTAELDLPGVERGPEGTVPFQLVEVDVVQNVPVKRLPPGSHDKEKRLAPRAVGDHYYANSQQSLTHYGGAFTISLFNTTISNQYSFALLQTAAANLATIEQTCELGWQIYPYINNGSTVPHVFSYWTTNGYKSQGDNVGGYNTFYKGFVQTDSSYYPGMTFSPLSTVNGAQYGMSMATQMYQGNWWLYVGGHWLGYYPGQYYQVNGQSAKTMASNGDNLFYYGEEVDGVYYPPHNDMGSGQFANQGFGKSAYIRNMTIYNTPTTYIDYNGGTGVSNTSWYTIDPHLQSGSSWGSYFFLGGPGAG